MKLSNELPLLLKSVVAGLALAVVFLLARMDRDEPRATSLPPALAGIVPAATSGSAETYRATFADAVEMAAPAVVNIYTAKLVVERPENVVLDPELQQFLGRPVPVPRSRVETSLGSGVILSDDGYVLTNHHVIRGADAIEVGLRDGRTAAARVAGVDPETDLAVLRIDLPDLPQIHIGHSDSVHVGDVVLAIGNPYGVGQTVTHGIVSATNRNRVGINVFEDFIQTDAAINPGNSGGALVNVVGDLIGINTAIVSRSGGAQGIGFAIPVATAIDVLRQIIAEGAVTRGWLGIEAVDVTPDIARERGLASLSGVLVRAVLNGGPADRAGIAPGDVLTGVMGQGVTDSRNAVDAIARMRPGTRVELDVQRLGKSMKLTAIVSRRPALNLE